MKLSTLIKGITKTNKILYTGVIAVGGSIIAKQAIQRLIENENNADKEDTEPVDAVPKSEAPVVLTTHSNQTLDSQSDTKEDDEELVIPVLQWFNEADESAMAQVKGLGASRAKGIVKHRPYASEDELLEASNGVGPTMLKRVESYLNP